jgi:hypothetical protein
MKKVIAFSLWGDKPKYTVGALRNAELAKTYYRNWECRFYCDEETVPEGIIQSLGTMANVKVIRMKASQEPHWSMFWRFYAADDKKVERCIFRDTDSRIGQREAMAVQEWIASGKGFHAMRDHPQHGTPFCGGMWGVCVGKINDIKGLINDYYTKGLTKTALFGLDQDFLTHSILPIAKDDMVEHDEFFAKKPFPMPRDPKHFVGQVYDENDNPQF